MLKTLLLLKIVFCVSVSFLLFWDTGADCVLRYGLWLAIIRPSRSSRSALVSDFAYLGTLVQIMYCVSVCNQKTSANIATCEGFCM